MTDFHTPIPLPTSILPRTLTPALAIDLARVRHNLAAMRRHLGGSLERWRPHIKTAKIPEVLKLLVDAGVRHFKCATTREAAVMLELLDARGAVGVDLLVAYPHLGPSLRRLGDLAHGHPRTRVSVLAESARAIPNISPLLGIFVDVDLGMRRTGVDVGEVSRIAALIEAAQAGGHSVGLHAYEGHIHSGPRPERRARTRRAMESLVQLHAALRARGFEVSEVVTSGTPSFVDALEAAPFHGEPGCVHRVSPGTVVYHDVRSQERVPELGLLPAAIVLSRVVSLPGDGRATCDAGSKSLAAEVGDPCVEVLGHAGVRALRPSEEHLPLELDAGVELTYGQVLQLAPHHVCPTVNLAERALLFDGGSFVGGVDVAARAHELLVD